MSPPVHIDIGADTDIDGDRFSFDGLSTNDDIKPLNNKTRHGFDEAYADYQQHLQHFYLYFHGKKYQDNFTAISEAEKRLKGRYYEFAYDWKNGRNKVNTTQGGIFICLNTTVDPPDNKKGKPCATTEGWIDPHSFAKSLAVQNTHSIAAAAVADNVMKQYKALLMKTTFKTFPDAVIDDLRKALMTWRRSNKESGANGSSNNTNRFLFHYNGHGVPNPTASGEFWVFNRQYTQYIPVQISELQTWLGAPSVLVFDCNKAGNLVNSFKHSTQVKIDQYNELQRKFKEEEQLAAAAGGIGGAGSGYNASASSTPPGGPGSYLNGNGFAQAGPQSARSMKNNPYLAVNNPSQFLDCYQFAACSSDEFLPSDPALPADLFTCCMTTPIEISVKFFLLRNPLTASYYEGLFDVDLFNVNSDFKQKEHKIRGFDVLYFKRTPEKKDQIADLIYIYTSITDTIAYTMVPRNLFRRCFRQDAACSALFRNFLLAQRIMKYYNCNPISDPVLPDCHDNELWQHWDLAIEHFLTSLVQLKQLEPSGSLSQALDNSKLYIFTNFFDTSLDHLKNWIQHGHYTMVPPPQLTMILQLLLTPKYRARALKMLAFFVDLGPWAVLLALNVGVFPYVVKLLQSPVIQLKPMLTFVWAKLLACDYKNMQYDLYASNGGCFKYFYYMLLPEKEALSALQMRHKNAYFNSIDQQAQEQKDLEAKIGRPALSIFKDGKDDYENDIVNGEDGLGNDEETAAAATAAAAAEEHDFEAQPNKIIDFDNDVGLTFHHLTVTLVVLTLFIKDYANARDKLLDLDLFLRVMGLIERGKKTHPSLQLWGALFLSQVWLNSPLAKYLAYKAEILPRLVKMFRDRDSIADLRAAIITCFTNYLTIYDIDAAGNVIGGGVPGVGGAGTGAGTGASTGSGSAAGNKLTEELELLEVELAEAVLNHVYDASVAVRKEMVIFLSTFIYKYLAFFQLAAFSSLQEEIVIIEAHEELFEFRRKAQIYGTIYSASWKALLVFSSDSHDEVQQLAEQVIVYVVKSINENPDLKEPFQYCYDYLVQKLVKDNGSTNGGSSYNDFDDSFGRNNRKNRRVVSMYNGSNSGTNTAGGGRGGHQRRSKRKSSGAHDNSYSDRESLNSVTSSRSFSGVDGLIHKTISISNFIKSMAGYNNDENDGHSASDENQQQRVRRHNSFSGAGAGGHHGQHQQYHLFKSAANYNLFDGQSYGSLPHPLPPRFDPKLLRQQSVNPQLPFKSKLLEFFTEYYQFPQLSPWPESHPLIDEYDLKFGRWRKLRNDAYIAKTQGDKELSLKGDWSVPLNTLATGVPTTKVFEFMQFDPYLVTSDSKDVVSVWDYEKNENLCQFSNNNPVGSRISQLQFMNEDDIPILLVGCNDGAIKLYKYFDDLERCRLISSWQTMNDVMGINDGTNFVFEWQQARGDLLATGNIKTINIWNAFKEKCGQKIAKRSPTPIVALTSDQLDGNIFSAGFVDGDIRVYDKRCGKRDAMIREWLGRSKDPSIPSRNSITNIHMQRGGFRELISATNTGLVQVWDIRMQEPMDSFQVGGGLKSMKVHEHAPVFATGSESVRLWSTAGHAVSDFYNDQRNLNLNHKNYGYGSSSHSYSYGYGNNNGGKVRGHIANLSLHPHKMVLAASSANDGRINVYHATAPDSM